MSSSAAAASMTSLRSLEACATPGATTSPSSPAQQTQHSQFSHPLHSQHHHHHQSPFAHRTVETQESLLGLATPASRPTSLLESSSTAGGAFAYLRKREEEKPLLNTSAAANDSTPGNDNDNDSISKSILSFNEPLLPSRRHLILQLFSAVDNVSDLQVSSAALRIITAQSEAFQFEPDSVLYGVAPSRLFAILDEEPGALQACLARFKRRLEREETETIQILFDTSVNEADSTIDDGSEDRERLVSVAGLLDGSCLQDCSVDVLDAFGLTNLIRLQIVDFLGRNVRKRSYNLAHYLLGLDSCREINSANNKAAFEQSCLPLLIDMLTYGLGHSSTDVPVLFTEHPALGIKLLQLLNALLPASQSIWTYLREERDLFLSLARDFGVASMTDADEAAVAIEDGHNHNTSTATRLISITYALLQRTELFRLLAMDIHEATRSGDHSYVSGVIEGLLADSRSGADCRLISFLAVIDRVSASLTNLQPASASAFDLAVRNGLLRALIGYTEAWSQLTGRVMRVASVAANGLVQVNPWLSAALGKLANSLQIWLSKLLVDSRLPAECIECLVQLCVGESASVSVSASASASARESVSASMSATSTTTATATATVTVTVTDKPVLALPPTSLTAKSITTVLLRPDLSPSTRCFLYAALMQAAASGIDSAAAAAADDSLLRVIQQVICKDVLCVGGDATVDDEFVHSLVTVAAGCLEALLPVLNALPATTSSAAAASVLSSFPSLLVSSLLADDAVIVSRGVDNVGVASFDGAAATVDSGDDCIEVSSLVLKWKAKWSLLLALAVHHCQWCCSSDSFTVPGTDSSFMARLSVLNSVSFLARGLERPEVLVHVLLPVLKFASLLGVRGSVRAEVLDRLLGRLSGGTLNGEVDYYLLTLVNRCCSDGVDRGNSLLSTTPQPHSQSQSQSQLQLQLQSQSQSHKSVQSSLTVTVSKLAVNGIAALVRSCRLGSQAAEPFLPLLLEECFVFLQDEPASIAPDFSAAAATGKLLSLGHLCQVLQCTLQAGDAGWSDSLAEKTLWLVKCCLQHRLGFLLPAQGMTAVYLTAAAADAGGGECWSPSAARELRTDAQVHLAPFLHGRNSGNGNGSGNGSGGVFLESTRKAINRLIHGDPKRPIIQF